MCDVISNSSRKRMRLRVPLFLPVLRQRRKRYCQSLLGLLLPGLVREEIMICRGHCREESGKLSIPPHGRMYSRCSALLWVRREKTSLFFFLAVLYCRFEAVDVDLYLYSYPSRISLGSISMKYCNLLLFFFFQFFFC